MKTNKKFELGMNAVSALRKHNKPVRVCDLAQEIGGSKFFLEQIMRELRLAGIVASIRGPGGGYKLVEQPLTAFHVAKALGRDFGTMSLDQAPLNRLSKAITEAYLNTTL